jgi:hypothetical protein
MEMKLANYLKAKAINYSNVVLLESSLSNSTVFVKFIFKNK